MLLRRKSFVSVHYTNLGIFLFLKIQLYNMRSCCFETRPWIKEVSFIHLRIFIGHLPHVLINRIMVLDNVHVLFHWIHFTDEEAMVWG